MNKNLQYILFPILLLLVPEITEACGTCFGDPSAPAVQGMNWAIITLLGITGGVLGGVISAIVAIGKKTKNFQQLNKR